MQCNKIVYPQERLSIDSQIYHKMCLRCKTCSTTLAIHNYVNVKGAIYCKRHVPTETSGPKINVHGELQLSPRPTGSADAGNAAPAAELRAPSRPAVIVPPLSPRSHQISMNYVNPRLSPRLPASAHPPDHQQFTGPRVSPRLPSSAHPAPTVLVHTSSNSKVAAPEDYANSAPLNANPISNSASSDEDEHRSPSPSSLANPADSGQVQRTNSKEGKDKDRYRSERTDRDKDRNRTLLFFA